MGKRQFKPGNMLYPVPAVMVSVADKEGKRQYHHRGLGGNGVHQSADADHQHPAGAVFLPYDPGDRGVCGKLTTEELARATDYCGVRSGRDTDKWADMGLTKEKASKVSVPLIRECPVNLECRVVRVDELGKPSYVSGPGGGGGCGRKNIWMKRIPSTCRQPGPWPTPTGGITAWGNAWEPLDTV